jgi:hypothetical protein
MDKNQGKLSLEQTHELINPTRQGIAQMLKDGFVVAPCSNPDCENLFASDTYCSICLEENA